jgi:hypothetical protein
VLLRQVVLGAVSRCKSGLCNLQSPRAFFDISAGMSLVLKLSYTARGFSWNLCSLPGIA